MPRQAYHQTASEALTLVQMAIDEAVALIPERVRREYWIAQKRGAVAPWREIESWYLGQEDCDRHMADILTDLILLSDAQAALIAATKERREGPVDLGLAKQKRAS